MISSAGIFCAKFFKDPMLCSFSCFTYVEAEAFGVDLSHMLMLLVEPIFNHSNRYFGDEFKAD